MIFGTCWASGKNPSTNAHALHASLRLWLKKHLFTQFNKYNALSVEMGLLLAKSLLPKIVRRKFSKLLEVLIRTGTFRPKGANLFSNHKL